MNKINYEIGNDSKECLTECKINNCMVGSALCINSCENFISDDKEKQIIECKIKSGKPRLPLTWKLIEEKEDGYMYRHNSGLLVIISDNKEDDNNIWRHVSFSRKNRIPSYDDLKMVKNLFLKDKKAFQIFSKDNNYVNIHKYCLHLWTCLTDDPLPEFSKNGSI